MGQPCCVRRRWWQVAATAVAAVTLLGATIDEPGDQVDNVDDLEARSESLDGEVERLTALVEREREELLHRTEQLEQAAAELAAIDLQLEIVDYELGEARARLRLAAQAHDDAADELDALTTELATSERVFQEQVAAAYSGQPGPELALVEVVLSEETIGDVLHSWERLTRASASQRQRVERVESLWRARRIAEANAEQTRQQRDEEQAAARYARETVAALRAEQADVRNALAEEQDRHAALLDSLAGEHADAEQLRDEARAELAAEREAAAALRTESGPADGAVVCPVPGARFIDDWHFPRSGGRLHKGNDLFADVGTPVLAPADGTVRSRNDVDRWRPGSQQGLGGKTVSVVTEPGTWWYFAHLDEVVDGVEPGTHVRAGEQIGTVGNTGNARHTPPHLHLGFYPRGEAHNPHPLVAPACR